MRTPSGRTVRAFLAGMLTVNSVGHLATAAADKQYLTPLAGRRSGPAINAVWGAPSLGSGLAVARWARTPGNQWGEEMHAFNAGAAVFAAWAAFSDRVMDINVGA